MGLNRTFRANLGWALSALMASAVLAALWNLGGAWQLERGLRSLGPTASVLASLVLLVMAAGIAAVLRCRPTVFVVLAAIAGLGVLVAAMGAFVQDASLWPSQSWRRAGVLLNGVGFSAVAAAAAAIAFVAGNRRLDRGV